MAMVLGSGSGVLNACRMCEQGQAVRGVAPEGSGGGEVRRTRGGSQRGSRGHGDRFGVGFSRRGVMAARRVTSRFELPREHSRAEQPQAHVLESGDPLPLDHLLPADGRLVRWRVGVGARLETVQFGAYRPIWLVGSGGSWYMFGEAFPPRLIMMSLPLIMKPNSRGYGHPCRARSISKSRQRY